MAAASCSTVPRALAQALAAKLGFYKLRAKVAVENLTENLGVLAVWDGEPATKPIFAFADPRLPALGWRILVPEELKQKVADLIGADLVDRCCLRGASDRCGRAARRARFHLWRRVSA